MTQNGILRPGVWQLEVSSPNTWSSFYELGTPLGTRETWLWRCFYHEVLYRLLWQKPFQCQMIRTEMETLLNCSPSPGNWEMQGVPVEEFTLQIRGTESSPEVFWPHFHKFTYLIEPHYLVIGASLAFGLWRWAETQGITCGAGRWGLIGEGRIQRRKTEQ